MSVVEKSFTSTLYTVILSVEEEEDGLRLDQFIQGHLASFSRQEVKRRIDAEHIKIQGRSNKLKPSTKVKFQDLVSLEIPRLTQEDEYWRGEKIKLCEIPEIVFEDEDLYAISKPAYMATHPTGKHIFNCATVYLESVHKQTVHSIHRLDRETSGVLMLAKNPKCAQIMTDHFENDRVRKCYFFISKYSALPSVDSFSAHERLGPIKEGLERIHIHAFPKDSKQGKRAHTFFKLVHHEGAYALGLAFPQTGRQHQIRVHAMTHGLPLVGDKIYLGSFKMFQRFKDGIATEEDHDLMELPRHALHALALQCPYKGRLQTFRSKLPEDFTQWLKTHIQGISLDQLEERLKIEVEDYFSKFES